MLPHGPSSCDALVCPWVSRLRDPKSSRNAGRTNVRPTPGGDATFFVTNPSCRVFPTNRSSLPELTPRVDRQKAPQVTAGISRRGAAVIVLTPPRRPKHVPKTLDSVRLRIVSLSFFSRLKSLVSFACCSCARRLSFRCSCASVCRWCVRRACAASNGDCPCAGGTFPLPLRFRGLQKLALRSFPTHLWASHREGKPERTPKRASHVP